MDHMSQTLENESVEGEEASLETLQYGIPTTPLLCEICFTGGHSCGHARIYIYMCVQDAHKRFSTLMKGILFVVDKLPVH